MLNIFTYYSGNQAIIAGIAFFVAILMSLSMHEFAHAYVAYKQGDVTAKAYGRLTLNPLKHLDPIGMLLLIFVGFGWAKPVPINPLKFKHYRSGIFFVSIAGITMNFLLFLIFTAISVLISNGAITLDLNSSLGFFVFLLVSFIATINLSLAIFNLIPIAPLDGFNMISAFSKSENSFLKFMNKNGQFILLILLISGILDIVMSYVYNFIATPITQLFTALFF